MLLCTDLLGKEGVTTHEKTNLLTEQRQNRLGHRKPLAVHTVTVFCDFQSVLVPSPDVSPVTLIPMIGYVHILRATEEYSRERFQKGISLAQKPQRIYIYSLAWGRVSESRRKRGSACNWDTTHCTGYVNG